MKKHYENVGHIHKRLRLSEDLLTEPSGASHEEDEDEDRWWDMARPSLLAGSSAGEEEAQRVTEQQRLRVIDAPRGTAHEGSPPSKWRLDANGKFASRLSPDYWLTRGSKQPAVAAVGVSRLEYKAG